MPVGSDPTIESASPSCRLIPIVILAEEIVVLSASVMETSVSATGLDGPPTVNVAL
jgi:hypothetical protein